MRHNQENWQDHTDRPCSFKMHQDDDAIATNDWPMYSYDRPAAMFWHGVINYLLEHGSTEGEVAAELAHKNMRRMLDNYDADIADLGYTMAQAYYGTKG